MQKHEKDKEIIIWIDDWGHTVNIKVPARYCSTHEDTVIKLDIDQAEELKRRL